MELMGMPKPTLDPRVGRILEVGTDSHRRIPRYFSPITFAREVLFRDEEYRIKGYADAIVFIPPSLDRERSGFYVVEIKTTGAGEFERIVDEKQPKEEHVRQCQIYLWGLRRYYGLDLRGGIIFYENRDTLEHRLFDIAYDAAPIEDLLGRVKWMLEGLKQGRLPEDYLPADHWAHRYCPYLDICEPGRRAVEYQKSQPKELPDTVLAQIIGERIVRKRRREREGMNPRSGARSLEALAQEFKWQEE